MKNLKTNVVKKPFHFEVTYSDGSTEQLTIEAESFQAAILRLLVLVSEGKYRLHGSAD